MDYEELINDLKENSILPFAEEIEISMNNILKPYQDFILRVMIKCAKVERLGVCEYIVHIGEEAIHMDINHPLMNYARHVYFAFPENRLR